MARPRKPDPERKSTRLAVRLTPAERLQIEQAAHQAGMSASSYIRAQILQGRVELSRHRSLPPALFDQIRRIGVNLNQPGKMPGDLPRVCKAIEDILVRELEGVPMPDEEMPD
jgi:uncharacterized protein (DUF1778 family)